MVIFYCPQCGSEILEKARFCSNCGHQITVETIHPAPVPDHKPEIIFTTEKNDRQEIPEAGTYYSGIISDKTGLVKRVLNLLIKPKTEWKVIATEPPDTKKILVGYVLLLAILPAVFSFLNTLIYSGSFSLGYALIQAMISYIVTIGLVFISAFVVDLLAPSFETEQNFDRSFQLVSYAYTPACVISILSIIPGVNFIAILTGFGYLAYLVIGGLQVIKKTPQDKASGYGILLVIMMLILYFLIGAILGFIFLHLLLKGMVHPG